MYVWSAVQASSLRSDEASTSSDSVSIQFVVFCEHLTEEKDPTLPPLGCLRLETSADKQNWLHRSQAHRTHI